LATMVVITAASMFLVVLGSSMVRNDVGLDRDELIDMLQYNGLWPDHGALDIDALQGRFSDLPAMEGMNGLQLIYRPMGNDTALAILGEVPPSNVTVISLREPVLLSFQERNVPGIAEVTAW